MILQSAIYHYADLPAAFISPWWAIVLVLLAVSWFLVWLMHWPGRSVKVKPIRASKFDPELVPNNLDTIVIGSGSGGCACSNILAQAGQRVLLLEQHPDRTGGCTHSFRQEGCEWDTGLHYTSIGMSQRTQRPGALLYFMTKGKQEWTRLQDPYDQVLFPRDGNVATGRPNSQIYDFVAGASNTVDDILDKIDPGNKELHQQAIVWMELCTIINDGFTALGLSRVLPTFIIRLTVQSRIDTLMKLASYTVWDVQYAIFNLQYSVQHLLKDTNACPKAPFDVEPDPVLRRVKAVLTHPIGDYAVQPHDATFAAHGITMAHYMQGAAYTVGPTQNISIRSSSLLRELGGEVFVDATVHQIIVENGRAVGVLVSNTSLSNKKCSTITNANSNSNSNKYQYGPWTEIRAKNIVCATSVYNLYNQLLPQEHPVVKDFQNPAKRSIGQSNGHVFLFCKIDGDPTELKLPTHNLWYFNGYDLDKAFDRYWKNPTGERPPTVYIGFPCTKDSTWKQRLPGVSNCVLISDGLWEWFAKWEGTEPNHRGPEYEQFKEQLSSHLLDILYEAVPQIKGKITFHTLGTPLSEVHYLHSWHAGSYGTKCVPEMFAEKNHKWTTTPHTLIPGLYLAGSDAFLPAVCGAMYGGCFGAAAVLGRLGTLRLTVAFLGDLAASLRQDDPKLSWIGSYYLAMRKFVLDD